MNKLQKALCVGVTVLALTGCKQEYQIGTVIKEYGANNDRLIPSQISGFFISGETVKIGNSYVLQIKADDGVYTASVLNEPDSSVTLEALSLFLKEGDKIKFATTNHFGINNRFNKNKVGIIYSGEIEVLSSKE
jgi:hypothetical protein